MLPDLLLVLCCWAMLGLWQVVGFAITYSLYANKSLDAAWGFGRLVTWLLLSLIIWFLAHLGLPVNNVYGVYGILLLLTISAVYFYSRRQADIKQFLKQNKRLILTQELIFLLLFLFLSFVRGFNARIEGLEKFMNVGFMAGYLRSSTLPAEDMWLAGYDINYYTFGHFMGAVATQFWRLSVDYSYNLLLGVIMGLTGMQAASLSINLVALLDIKRGFKVFKQRLSSLKGHALKAGILAAVLLVFAGNGYATWYGLNNLSFEGLRYPTATRFIANTIHEFLAYSFIVSDLHAHVWALPIVLFLLFNIACWLRDISQDFGRNLTWRNIKQAPYSQQSVIIGVLLGVAICTSTWDFLVYSLLLLVIGAIVLFFEKNKFIDLALSAVIMITAALFIASPWFLNFESISQGFRLVADRSPLWQLAVLWLPHLVMSLIAAALLLRRLLPAKKFHENQVGAIMVLALAATAVLLLILPEVVYLKDIYPNHPRANTMFKLTFQAFIMMTIIASLIPALLAIISAKNKLSRWRHLFLKTTFVLLLLSISYYSYFGYRDFYGGFNQYQGLDGLVWLEQQAPNDYEGIVWLRSQIEQRPVILEAVGESYTRHARVSTFTGLPTVLGWRVHQWLWRGSFDIPAKRTSQVQQIYELPTSDGTQQLIADLNLEYVFVGSLEHSSYEVDEDGLKTLGKVVFQSGPTYILQL